MKVLVLLFPFMVSAQDSTIIRKYGVFDHATIEQIESLVSKGELTRREADNRYVYYLQNNQLLFL